MNRFHAAILGALAIGAMPAHATDCRLSLEANDLMQFNQKTLEVPPSCTAVELTLTHTGHQPAQVMGHNWVLARAADLTGVTVAGQNAGRSHNYQAPGDKRILAATPLVGGGESTTVTFSAEALRSGETYAFFCTTPGHSSIMRGSLIVVGSRESEVATSRGAKRPPGEKAATPAAAVANAGGESS